MKFSFHTLFSFMHHLFIVGKRKKNIEKPLFAYEVTPQRCRFSEFNYIYIKNMLMQLITASTYLKSLSAYANSR
jgi:hypothetical protein